MSIIKCGKLYIQVVNQRYDFRWDRIDATRFIDQVAINVANNIKPNFPDVKIEKV